MHCAERHCNGLMSIMSIMSIVSRIDNWNGVQGGTVPCQILLRGIRHKQHERRHHLFSPFSWTVARVVGPFCMYGSCIARSAKGE